MQRFFVKFMAFLAILLAIQVLVSILNPPELPEEIVALEQQIQAGVDILYLGDSTLIHPVGEPTIPEILRELVPDRTIGEVAHPAYNLDLYERYVNYLIEHQAQVEAVIIPINMRSFSPEWDLRPSYQFEREKTILTYGPLLSTIFYRPFDTFGLFDSPISQSEFQAATVFNGDQPVGAVAEFEALIGTDEVEADDGTDFAYYSRLPSEDEVEALEGTLIYYYMSGLDRHHRKIQSLKAMSRLLAENGIKQIFYITPINYELGERYLGPEFHDQVAENTEVIEKVLSRKNVDVLNLVFDLAAFNFVDTEHMTENGKTYVAEVLAEAIEPGQPEQSVTAVDDAPTPRSATLERPGQPDRVATPTPTATATATATARSRATTATATPEPDDSPPRRTPAASATALAAAPEAEATSVRRTPTSESTATPPPSPTPRSPAAQQAGQLVSVQSWASFEPVGNYVIDVYRIRYLTLAQNGQLTEVEANLYVPLAEEPTEFPILVYGPGTTGLSDRCAPLNEGPSGSNWGLYHSYMYEYTGQGFIGVLPNYQGFDDEGDLAHPYFVAEYQARALLDAARAATNFFAESPEVVARPLEAVMFAGYSSGGHAAFAAKDLAASYAPEVPVKGIIGHGPTTNLKTLFRESPVFTPYIVQAYRDVYGPEVVDPADIFQDRWLTRFEADVMTRCVDDVFAYYSFSARGMYRPAFSEALYSDRLQAVTPAFAEALDANSAGLSAEGTDIPVLILQGTADQIVTPPSQLNFATELCNLGNSVTYFSYPAVDHPDIRRASYRDTVAWIQSIANGETPVSDCADLTNP